MTAAGLDPRGPRFGAGITAALLLVAVGLALPTASAVPATVAGRAAQPAFLLAALLTALFLWGALAGVGRHPWGLLFRALVRPRLGPPAELEDPAAPTFAQAVGAFVMILGVVLHLAGVPWGLAGAAAAAFVAAFLNAVFGYCLGCQLYLLLVRSGLVRGGSRPRQP
ncbi:DUF4395 domain-containing protein [Zhihengliuella salsuginis]|uniref:Membrane protein n=1 Tax=Zhihengliuella salsuginis TaxID=578222 RepID=A0ABQ3GB13_9MICC|nr:DUF4395 domain-containing protein [Zhihengliuella salsuginis]GHD00239.1 membrane protein [Zhihengliuella salsuginis]